MSEHWERSQITVKLKFLRIRNIQNWSLSNHNKASGFEIEYHQCKKSTDPMPVLDLTLVPPLFKNQGIVTITEHFSKRYSLPSVKSKPILDLILEHLCL